MKPALENRIRDAIREGMNSTPSAFKNNLDGVIDAIAFQECCTPADARAVWDKHFAITEAN